MGFETFVALGTFTLAGLYVSAFVGLQTRTLAPALVAFSIRWVGALSVFALIGLGAPDAGYYDSTAIEFVEGNFSVHVTAGKEGWPVLLSVLYGTFGHLPQLGLIVNATCGALTASLIGQASHMLGASGRLAAWIAALFPTGIIWSVLLLRESVTWLSLALCTIGFIGLAVRRRIGPYVAIVVAGVLVLLLFRGTAAVIVAVTGLVAVAYVKRQLVKTALAALAVTPLVLVSPIGQRLDDVVGGFSIEGTNNSRMALSTEASTGWPYVDMVDIPTTMEALSISVPRVLLGPYPWEWISISPLLALDGITWLVALGLVIVGFSNTPDRRKFAVLIFPAAALLLALMLTSGNYGTMQRIRLQSVFILTPLIAAGVAASLPRRRARKYIAAKHFPPGGGRTGGQVPGSGVARCPSRRGFRR